MKRITLSILVLMALALFAGTLAAQEPAGEKAEKAKPAVKAETISGKVSMVVADKKLLVLTAASGIPYNFQVTGGSRIMIDGKKAKLDALAAQTGKTATVKFLPLRTGNRAQSIEVGP